ncbi:diguanylate cyclase [bacterium]|nr:diguanylate cyclase [bacterium]
MKPEEIKRIFFSFLKSDEWSLITEILDEMKACYQVIDNEAKVISCKIDNQFCGVLKKNNLNKQQCAEFYQQVIEEAKRGLDFKVSSCYMGFIVFAFPLIVKGEVMGMVLGSQIVNCDLALEKYLFNFERYGISKEFLCSLHQTQVHYTFQIIKNEINLVSWLARLAIEEALISSKLEERDDELEGIIESYKMFEESQNSQLRLTKKMIYTKIVNIAAKALDAEICSLMLVDQEKKQIYIEDALGLDKNIISKVSLSLGEGVAGHVIRSGKSLLIKDISQDIRFGVKHKPLKYYTRSLIISPLKVKGEIIGVININNKSNRRSFEEKDLELLNVICGHAGAALESLESETSDFLSKDYEILKNSPIELKEKVRKEKIDKEDLEDKDNLIKELKEKIVEFSKFRKETEEEVTALKSQREQMKERLREEEERIRAYQEKINLLKDTKTEVIEKGTGHEEELNRIKKEVEDFRNIHEELKKITALQEKAKQEKDTVNIEKYNNMIEELETKRKELEEVEEKTKELNLLFNITKELISPTKIRNILECSLNEIFSFYNYHAASFIFQEENKEQAVIKLSYPLGNACIEELKEQIQNNWAGIKKKKKIKKLSFELIPSKDMAIATQSQEKISSYIFVPLKENKEVVGLININSFKDYAYTAMDKKLLSIVGNQISLALERVKLFNQVKKSAELDELTKLYNYRYFEKYFEKAFKDSLSLKKSLSLIIMDLDYFKKVNDEYGHAQGNKLLKTVASLIKHEVKEAGIVVRFGGDEFAIVLPKFNQEKAFILASKVKDRLNNCDYQIDGKNFRLSTSIGIASLPNQKIKISKELFKRADRAVYLAKEQGRDRVVTCPAD